MDDFLSRLGAGLSARRGDRSRRAAAWSELCMHFPPSIEACAVETPPSTLLARDAGDLGVAVLWIVQAALARPIADETGMPPERLSPLSSIGALAHSEDPARPMRLWMDGGGVKLSGRKKYITGGMDADWIIITALEKEGEGPRAVYVPAAGLPAGALEEIDLGMLRTTSHARLTLSEQSPEGAVQLPADGRTVRRAIKRWGMVERALILEAYAGLCLRLARLIGMPDIQGRLDELMASISSSRRGLIAAAMAGERLAPGGVDIAELARIASSIGDQARGAGSGAEDEPSFDDLKLARLFSPGPPRA